MSKFMSNDVSPAAALFVADRRVAAKLCSEKELYSALVLQLLFQHFEE